MKTKLEFVRVSAKSNPNSVAGAIVGILREQGSVEVSTIGAGALSQATKAVAIARGFVAPNGIDLISIPAFEDVVVDGEVKTSIKLIVQPR
jgi:stage V sporulation protein S